MKKIVVNLCLCLFSILGTLGVLEIVVRQSVTHFPRSTFNLFAREFQILGQTSKEGIVPKPPYLAIVGDSYGVGKGDWFTNIKYDRNSRYQATHLLQEQLGIDVLSLSRSGSGNYDGLALFARNALKVISKFGFKIPEPEVLIVYFYEGNDIADNLRFMEKYFSPQYDESKLFSDEYFSKFVEDMDSKFVSGRVKEIEGNYLVIKGIGRAFETLKNRLRTEVNTQPYGKVKAKIGDEIVEMQDDVLDLEILNFNEEQIRKGIRFFERSLDVARDSWGKARRVVVFIPSPMTSYATLEPEKDEKRLKLSAKIEDLVREASVANGYEFFSSAPAIRKAAQNQQVHGPWDWSHLNKIGYGVLAQEIIRAYQSTSD